MYGMFELTKKSNDQNCVNSKANCVHYMYRMSGCVEKLNIQNSENLTRNSILYMYGMSGFAENWISRTAKIQREIVYIIYVRKVWICRKIEYP